jgi:hypothetical protein
MCDMARKRANWYTTTHKNDRGLTVEDISEMFESGDIDDLAQRVSKSSVLTKGLNKGVFSCKGLNLIKGQFKGTI